MDLLLKEPPMIRIAALTLAGLFAASARQADIPFEGRVSDDVGLMAALGAVSP